MKTPQRVFVGLSGGVDSSVAAALLKEAGFDVVGVFLKNWSDDTFAECPWKKDWADAQAVGRKLGIHTISWNFEREYRKRVIDSFFAEYAAGRTPNPDIVCNKEIKFGLFLEKALHAGADYVATGHYAKIMERDGQKFLARPKDLHKDQTYFLYTLGDKQLARVLFPLADLTKTEVRAKAKALNLPNADKPDSQGICFVGEVNLFKFLKSRLPEVPGDIRTIDGKTIGQHSGVWFSTIGQRHGLGVGGGIPYYVASKNLKTNTLVVAPGSDHPALYTKKMIVSNLLWRSSRRFSRLHVRLRHGGELVSASVRVSGSRANVRFDEAQRAITPGQAAVFYHDNVVLGGGVIDEAPPAETTAPFSQKSITVH